MQGDSGLFRQPARRCLARVSHHHPKHDPPLSPGRGPAHLHAPVRRCEAGGVVRPYVRATDLPEHGGRRVQKRPGGPESHDTARPAVRSADRVHAHHQRSLSELPARLSRGCLLHGQESETHTAIGAGAVSGNLRVWLVGRGAGGGASDRRSRRQVPEGARGEVAPNEGVGAGVRVGIIAREDGDEAWRVARERFPEDRRGQLTHQLAMKVSDSVWHGQLSDLADATAAGDSPYWLVPFENYKTMCPYLVGSYERVGDELSRYMSVGYRSFILDIPPTQEELHHTNQAFRRALTLASR